LLYPAELRAHFIAIGAITESKTLLVSKGPKRVRFELHHYRLAQVKANVIILGGSGLVIFVFQGLIFFVQNGAILRHAARMPNDRNTYLPSGRIAQ
jgi:hypothetical protein